VRSLLSREKSVRESGLSPTDLPFLDLEDRPDSRRLREELDVLETDGELGSRQGDRPPLDRDGERRRAAGAKKRERRRRVDLAAQLAGHLGE